MGNEKQAGGKAELLRMAFLKSLPVMCGYVFLGIAFGIMAEEAGLAFGWVLLMSLIIFAGSMQFVMVPLLVGAVSPITMALTALFVNGRHIFYGVSFVESFKKMKHRWYMIFALTDETYSVLCGCKNEDPEEKKRDAWFWIALMDQSYWVLGSVVGALLGAALPFDFTGIDFSMTALFVVILMEQILGNKRIAGPAALIGLVVGTISLFIFGTSGFLLPALLVSVMILSVWTGVSGRKEEKE
ncbi:MAG: AzlC family ABC transporter permease [Lachnospiraceae bacterium]|nr:AzlC family ABC transporter permease [Lachnospiraceae bacterium]